MIKEKQLFVSLAKKEYKKKLYEALSEIDMYDEEGQPLVSKDLKVTHADSGYEYTVDKVMGDRIVLRSPESPRFVSQGEEEILGGPANEQEKLDEDDIAIPQQKLSPEIPIDAEEVEVEDIISPGEEEEEVLFVIDQEEFEREYEIK